MYSAPFPVSLSPFQMIHIRLALRLDLLPKTKYFDVKCPFRFVESAGEEEKSCGN